MLDIPESHLITSMDAVGFATSDCPTTYRKWIHTDWRTDIPQHIISLQGIYYATETGTNYHNATTAIVPDSHTRQLTYETVNEMYSQLKRLVMSSNSLLIFNSKLVH